MTREVVKKSVVVGMLVLCLGVCMTSCIGGSNQHLTVSDGHPEKLGGIPPKEEWNKTFGGIYDDNVWSFQQTSDDEYILVSRHDSKVG